MKDHLRVRCFCYCFVILHDMVSFSYLNFTILKIDSVNVIKKKRNVLLGPPLCTDSFIYWMYTVYVCVHWVEKVFTHFMWHSVPNRTHMYSYFWSSHQWNEETRLIESRKTVLLPPLKKILGKFLCILTFIFCLLYWTVSVPFSSLIW